jgi:hypothetical protein
MTANNSDKVRELAHLLSARDGHPQGRDLYYLYYWKRAEEIVNDPYKQAWAIPPALSEEQKLLLTIARETLDRELNFLWQRAQFFWALNAAALGGIGFLTASEAPPGIAFLASLFGLITAWSWTLTNRGSKYWYENWEKRVELDPSLKNWFEPSRIKEDRWRRRFSQSTILIATSDMILGFWVVLSLLFGALILKDYCCLGDPTALIFLGLFVSGVLVFFACHHIWCSSIRPFITTNDNRCRT